MTPLARGCRKWRTRRLARLPARSWMHYTLVWFRSRRLTSMPRMSTICEFACDSVSLFSSEARHGEACLIFWRGSQLKDSLGINRSTLLFRVNNYKVLQDVFNKLGVTKVHGSHRAWTHLVWFPIQWSDCLPLPTPCAAYRGHEAHQGASSGQPGVHAMAEELLRRNHKQPARQRL